jgi:hypothetical protein
MPDSEASAVPASPATDSAATQGVFVRNVRLKPYVSTWAPSCYNLDKVPILEAVND